MTAKRYFHKAAESFIMVPFGLSRKRLTENGKNIFKPWQWTEYNGGALHRIPSKPCKGVMDAKTKRETKTFVNFSAMSRVKSRFRASYRL